jgi:hypothetical protein
VKELKSYFLKMLQVGKISAQPSLRGTKQSQTTQIGFAKLLCKEGIASYLAMTGCRMSDLRSFKNFVSLSPFVISTFSVFHFDTPMIYVLLTSVHSKKACHPELVEGACAEAFAHMLRQAQQDSPFLKRQFIFQRFTKFHNHL